MKFALIGGTGIDEMAGFTSEKVLNVSTRYGNAEVLECIFCEKDIYFLPRHGLSHSVAPAQINYRAQIAGLKKLGVEQVIGISAVGSLTRDLIPGSFTVLSDFIDLTRHRKDTFFDDPSGPVVHTDFTHPYCPEISSTLINACIEAGVEYKAHATYVGVDGPRYESPAEIKLYSSWGGDVVGMTNLPEVVLAKEAGLCYGAISIVTNFAAGICPAPLCHDEVRAAVLSTTQSLSSILRNSIANLPVESRCRCRSNSSLIV